MPSLRHVSQMNQKQLLEYMKHKINVLKDTL
jgi:hypothetical protein